MAAMVGTRGQSARVKDVRQINPGTLTYTQPTVAVAIDSVVVALGASDAVCMLKIDTEGLEAAGVRSASRLLSWHEVRAVQVELPRRSVQRACETQSMLRDLLLLGFSLEHVPHTRECWANDACVLRPLRSQLRSHVQHISAGLYSSHLEGHQRYEGGAEPMLMSSRVLSRGARVARQLWHKVHSGNLIARRSAEVVPRRMLPEARLAGMNCSSN